jgi:hypothetical protein
VAEAHLGSMEHAVPARRTRAEAFVRAEVPLGAHLLAAQAEEHCASARWAQVAAMETLAWRAATMVAAGALLAAADGLSGAEVVADSPLR